MRHLSKRCTRLRFSLHRAVCAAQWEKQSTYTHIIYVWRKVSWETLRCDVRLETRKRPLCAVSQPPLLLLTIASCWKVGRSSQPESASSTIKASSDNCSRARWRAKEWRRMPSEMNQKLLVALTLLHIEIILSTFDIFIWKINHLAWEPYRQMCS